MHEEGKVKPVASVQDHAFGVLGKRGNLEQEEIKQTNPKKCLGVHASSLNKSEKESCCDICPALKNKKLNKSTIRSSWHCSICDFNFCQSCSAMARQFARPLAKRTKYEKANEDKIELESDVGANTVFNACES